MSIHIPQELENEVVRFTDVGEWKHSWHWDRDRSKAWSPITIKGAEQMLADLNCSGSMEAEIAAMARKIKARYDVAGHLRRLIDKARVREVADSHADECVCDCCVAAGYLCENKGVANEDTLVGVRGGMDRVDDRHAAVGGSGLSRAG